MRLALSLHVHTHSKIIQMVPTVIGLAPNDDFFQHVGKKRTA